MTKCPIYSIQTQVDFKKLLDDNSEDEEPNAGTKAFSSDDEFVENGNGGNGSGSAGREVISDSEDSPVKKPAPKKKLGPKPTAKRTKIAMSDSDSSDYGARNVSVLWILIGIHHILILTLLCFVPCFCRRKRSRIWTAKATPISCRAATFPACKPVCLFEHHRIEYTVAFIFF